MQRAVCRDRQEREGEMKDCKGCGHYELYKMITSNKPYGYSGDIPCLRCIHYNDNDEFTPKINNQPAMITQTKELLFPNRY